MNCIIIEDDFMIAVNIQRMVEELGYTTLAVLNNKEEVGQCQVFEEADIILSDVKLGKETFAFNLLKERVGEIPVILFSSYVEPELYEQSKVINPYIYLTKPIDKITLRSAIEGATKKRESKPSSNDIKIEKGNVFVKSRGKLVGIKLREILFVTSEGNYCYIYLESSKLVIKSSLKKAIEVLDYNLLIQAHRGYYVNVSHVEHINISNGTIKIEDHSIPMGRKYKSTIMKLFEKLI